MRALYSVVNNITLKLSREIDIESWREIKFKVFGAKSLHVLLKGFMSPLKTALQLQNIENNIFRKQSFV